MGFWPFRRSRADEDAQQLLGAVTQAARRPELYGPGRIPDTIEGRIEALTLIGVLALVRLKAEPTATTLAQTFTDQLFSHFDAGLRELGVGDTAVPKRMHKLAGAFYGRLDAYSKSLVDVAPDSLIAALERNAGVTGAFARRLAEHMQHVAAAQSAAPVSALLSAEGWPTLQP
jgi:cytochrome b pre-mRNA-processing protein 3